MATVKFFVMRHGEKSGGPGANELTPKGFSQVAASAKRYLASPDNSKPKGLYHSGQWRAHQTAEVCNLVGGWQLNPIREDGFNFTKAAEGRQPFAEAQARVKARVDKGEAETVAMWLEEWDAAPVLREQVTATLKRLALAHCRPNHDAGEVSIVAASHAPTAELASPTPEATPRLNEADIAVYTVQVDGEQVNIISCDVLPCPPQ